jgi:hypothetical protein
MSTTVNLNGQNYTIPSVGEGNWGTQVTNYLVALASGVLQKAGGSFTLTADVDFGATYGLKSTYFSARSAGASAGFLRAANNTSLAWRNAANNADLNLKVNASDILEYNGNPLVTLALGAADTVLRMNAAGTAYEFSKLVNANIDVSAAIAYSKLNLSTSIVNADISGLAAIAYSKLNLSTSIVNADIAVAAAIAHSKMAANTASRALVSDASGFTTAATTTATEIGYVNGVTSAIQAQLNGKMADTGDTMTGNLIMDNAKEIRFSELDANGSNYIGFKAPDTVTADKTFVLPNGDGTSNQVLKTDGSGNLGWASVAAGIGVNFDINIVSSANYTILDNDGYRHILVTTGASNRTITLPTAADNTDRMITIKKVDSGVGIVIIDGEGAETIDGATTYTLDTQYQQLTIVCNGTSWSIVSGKIADSTNAGLISTGDQIISGIKTLSGGIINNGLNALEQTNSTLIVGSNALNMSTTNFLRIITSAGAGNNDIDSFSGTTAGALIFITKVAGAGTLRVLLVGGGYTTIVTNSGALFFYDGTSGGLRTLIVGV